ncbi:DUF2878 domain-containing protein [Pseudoalteromonas luteoviolacea]|uniref:DUF2878 domain-containing protein n=1 Tax=Pseudoalteromonas luteoviolacea H33 TaxID=1365251 RepID=A0A167B906_9GAMM|nr:DUF2878 domain-containing protein [Pseudoalteromonas luteoviolacea]KZN46271.1 hypothetical protein N476_03850 [Pseudoalteromonas luteoviolacea H33]KZN75074.1 hypothetical protein N477_19545 [Pseudoalteromonas luteoviolacea H33-S]MBQ4875909.1 DUF2878 domain-containing protein [Pseudoalteromonas luteoviolacea]MBQ4904944.1 DUF2878 domain-containing protein [Pseudoalteromonas luteoviolacea]
MMKKYSVVTNFVLFQLAWFAVFFLKEESLLVVLTTIALMFALSPAKSRDVKFVLVGISVGMAIELVAVTVGVIDYGPAVIPLWLLLLWLALLFSFRESLNKLFHLPLKYRAPIVWLCTPGSYYAGSKAGVLSTLEPLWIFWIVYGAIWFVGFECLRWLDAQSHIRRNGEVLS